MSTATPQPLAIPLSASDLAKSRRQRERKRELICHTHDKIEDAADRIKMYDLTETRISDIDRVHNEILELAEYICELTTYAKERGQAMEDRLYEYSNAITDLGYKRKK